MTKSNQSLSKKVNLNDFSNAISPVGAILTFAFCLLFFICVLQPTTYNTEFTFELTQLLSMKSFTEYKFSYSNNEIPLVVFAGIVIGIAMIIPGVSVGTLAVLLNIYYEMIYWWSQKHSASQKSHKHQ